METEKIIRLSVRNLVEFILKEGDIDNRISGTLDKDAMLMGGRLHRKIQRMMGSNYQAEVSLKMQVPCDGFQLKLEGRADGILLESEKTIIDEIKGVVRSLDRVERPVPVHLAQAKCYAYIYARQQGLKQISVQMTYCNLDTEDVKRFREEYTFEELEKWFLDLVHQGRHRLTKIIQIVRSSQFIVKAHIADSTLIKIFLRQISCRTAADAIFCHTHLLLIIKALKQLQYIVFDVQIQVALKRKCTVYHSLSFFQKMFAIRINFPKHL